MQSCGTGMSREPGRWEDPGGPHSVGAPVPSQTTVSPDTKQRCYWLVRECTPLCSWPGAPTGMTTRPPVSSLVTWGKESPVWG